TLPRKRGRGLDSAGEGPDPARGRGGKACSAPRLRGGVGGGAAPDWGAVWPWAAARAPPPRPARGGGGAGRARGRWGGGGGVGGGWLQIALRCGVPPPRPSPASGGGGWIPRGRELDPVWGAGSRGGGGRIPPGRGPRVPATALGRWSIMRALPDAFPGLRPTIR